MKDFITKEISEDSEFSLYVLKMFLKELERAEKKFPEFPTDPIHAAAIVVEEAGELQQSALKATYEDGTYARMLEEAIQVGAMALRFVVNLRKMNIRPAYGERLVDIKVKS